jgi:hypothetical protein
MTTSFPDPWFTDRPRSGATTQVCQPLRPASLASAPGLAQSGVEGQVLALARDDRLPELAARSASAAVRRAFPRATCWLR